MLRAKELISLQDEYFLPGWGGIMKYYIMKYFLWSSMWDQAHVVFGQSSYYGVDLEAPTQIIYQQPQPIHTYQQVSKWISQGSA